MLKLHKLGDVSFGMSKLGELDYLKIGKLVLM